jgi:hypothetical protein
MAAIFSPGDVFQLVGLESTPSLNGAIGTVVGDVNESRGRYVINLKSPAAAVAAHPSGMSLKPMNLMKVTECARPSYDQLGTKGCSACPKEFYCSAECQKSDWKMHKITWPFIKVMSDVLLPFIEVATVIGKVRYQTDDQIAKLGRKNYVRLLHHVAKFAEYQYGKRVAGTSSYNRKNGSSVQNWEVEYNLLYNIYNSFTHYDVIEDHGGDVIHYWKQLMPYMQKALALLEL